VHAAEIMDKQGRRNKFKAEVQIICERSEQKIFFNFCTQNCHISFKNSGGRF